jgi:hypothetical protein
MGMTEIEKRAIKGGASFAETLAAPIPDACRISGLSRSEIYGSPAETVGGSRYHRVT